MNEKDRMICEKILEEYFWRKEQLIARAKRLPEQRAGLAGQLDCMWNLTYNLLLDFQYVPVTDPQKCEIVWGDKHYKYEFDDYGQQIVVKVDDRDFSCGAYNDMWDIDVIYAIEDCLNELEVKKIIDNSEK